MTIPQIQISLFLDSSGNVHGEASGANGVRLKVDLGRNFAIQNPEVMERLWIQENVMREKQRAKLRETQNQNIQYVAQTPGMGLTFAKQIWHDPNLVFNRRVVKHLFGEAGNFNPSPQSIEKVKTKKPERIARPRLNITI